MRKNELSTPLMITTKTKKYYTSPKIEVIGDIKDATRGGGMNAVDSAGQSPFGQPPSQPVGQ